MEEWGTKKNRKNQEKVSAAGGIDFLVALLQRDEEHGKEEAAAPR